MEQRGGDLEIGHREIDNLEMGKARAPVDGLKI
jgi:hypothetical protein